MPAATLQARNSFVVRRVQSDRKRRVSGEIERIIDSMSAEEQRMFLMTGGRVPWLNEDVWQREVRRIARTELCRNPENIAGEWSRRPSLRKTLRESV
jgi:hypothetical protein